MQTDNLLLHVDLNMSLSELDKKKCLLIMAFEDRNIETS
jgi:hypothetical protein